MAYNKKLLHPTILREYDIRGIVDDTLDSKDAYYIGKAFGSYIQEKGLEPKICVSFDGRKSSVGFEESLVKGLISTGVDVIRIGLGPTPMLYYATRKCEAGGGIMITGSHNPPEYNGFKFMAGKLPLFGKEILYLGELIAESRFKEGNGSVEFVTIDEQYIKHLLSSLDDGVDSLKIAWDPGNGAGAETLTQLVSQLPGEHILLNNTVDGNFPAHHPDPTVEENLVQLIETVVGEHCDFGIAFDGDADRIGIVDNKGSPVWGDQIMVLFSRYILDKYPGTTIIADVKTSQLLFDYVKSNGGKPMMWKTGHSLIKTKMAQIECKLAGEMSGHIFFADNFGFDDALYASIIAMNIVSKLDVTLSDFFDTLPSLHNTPEIRVDVSEERKFSVIDEVKSRLKDNANIVINDIDGLRVTNDDGWWLLRASNTQNCLVVRCEGKSAEALGRLKEFVDNELQLSGVL